MLQQVPNKEEGRSTVTIKYSLKEFLGKLFLREKYESLWALFCVADVHMDFN